MIEVIPTEISHPQAIFKNQTTCSSMLLECSPNNEIKILLFACEVYGAFRANFSNHFLDFVHFLAWHLLEAFVESTRNNLDKKLSLLIPARLLTSGVSLCKSRQFRKAVVVLSFRVVSSKLLKFGITWKCKLLKLLI